MTNDYCGEVDFSNSKESDEKNYNKLKKKTCSVFTLRDFCLSCHGDALWADTSGGNRLCRLVLLLHVCMCPCAAHTNTHTDQCTVRCLWRMVAYWTSASASKEQCHPQKDSSSTPEDFAKGGERHLYNILGTARLLSPKTTWWSIWFLLTGDWMNSQRQSEGFYSQQQSHTQFMSVLVPRVYGCNHAKGKHQDIPLDYHFTRSKFGVHCLYFLFIFFFAQNQDYFWSLELDQHFFLLLLFEAKFSHVLMSAWSLIDCYDFCTLPYFYRWSGDGIGVFFFVLSSMLIILSCVKSILVMCRLVKIK